MANLKGITDMVGMVERTGKRVARAVPTLLPVITVAANVADIANTSGGNLAVGLNEFVKRYAAVDMSTGKIDGDAFMKGGGTLILSGLAGMAVKALM